MKTIRSRPGDAVPKDKRWIMLPLLAGAGAAALLAAYDWAPQIEPGRQALRLLHAFLLASLCIAIYFCRRHYSVSGDESRLATDIDTRIHAAMDAWPALAWVVRADGAIEQLNQQALSYTGMTSDELKTTFEAIVHPDDIEDDRSVWQQMLQSGEPAEREHRYRRADGAYRWFQTRSHPLRDNAGRIERWCFVSWEIDSRRLAEIALRESESRLRHLIDSLPCVVAVAGPDGNLEYANQRNLGYFGKSMSEVAGLGWLEGIHPEDRGAVASEWARCNQACEPMDIDHRLRRHDGVYRWYHARVEPVLDDEGRVVRWYGALFDIDDQWNMAQILRESESGLRVLVDAIPGMLVVTSADGEVEYVNQPTLDAIGVTLEAFRGSSWRSIIHPDDADTLVSAWVNAVQSREPLDAEYRQLCANQTYRWWHIRVHPHRDSAGNIIRWYGVINDINERKVSETLLRESESGLRVMVDTIPGMISLISTEGRVEYVNQPLLDANVGGIESARDWSSRIHPDDMELTQRHFRNVLGARQPAEFEYRRLYPDGQYRWFHVRMNPFFNEQNEIVRWYALMVDVDDRRKAEDALRESVEQLRAIIDTLPAFVWQASPSGSLLYLNQRLLDYTGVSFEDHILSGWSGVVHPDDAEDASSNWRHSISTGEPYRVTKRYRRADGAYRWFEERANPMLDHAREVVCWYGIDFDIEDSKQMEDALRTERTRLARALKVSAVGELSASIAHELNQPLAAVVANGHACLRWLSSEPPNLERARLTALNIVRDGNSAAEVVSRIRALFKKAPPEKTELNLNDVIREALRLLDDEIRNNSVSIAEDLEKELPQVSADRVQMQQTLVNLLRNAIEAMEAVDQQARLLSLTSRIDQSNAVVIHVRDQGIGIDNVDRTFEPFFTTKANGLGLGLSICRSIVEAHGGRLWASANQGPGTTFSFTVPIANT